MSLKASCPALAMMLLFGGAAAADEPDRAGGRFTMSPVDGGFLRLDSETGAVAMCTKSAAQWSCNAVEDKSGQSGRSDVAKLESENRGLKDRVKALEDALETGKPGDLAGIPRANVQIHIPSEAEIDQALNYMERTFKKIRDRIKNLDKPLAPGEERPDKQSL